MSGCLDRVSCSCQCDCLESVKEWVRPKRNMFASILAGTLFSVGWWVVIDSNAEFSAPLYAAYHMCGIFSTIALLMINAVSTGQVTGESYTEGCLGQKGARVWLFVGFVFAFGGLIGSLWVFIQEFLVKAVTEDNSPSAADEGSGSGNSTTPSPSTLPGCFPCWWQGVSFFLQNLLIFFSTLIFKFGRTEEEVW